jgi:hypothetical protein
LKPKAKPCPVPSGLDEILPSYRFADAFAIEMSRRDLDANAATHLVFSRQPGWIAALIRLRDRIVAPLGLKGTQHAPSHASIGGFPVVSEGPERVVLGFDDKHLDFRIVVDAFAFHDGGRGIRATTLVKPHHIGGRVYLKLVMPFHRRIVPNMLNSLNSGAG